MSEIEGRGMKPIVLSVVVLVLAACTQSPAIRATGSPTSSAPPRGVFYDLSGHSDGGLSDPFYVSGGDWELVWSYSCPSDPADSPFPVGIHDSAGHLHPGARVEQFHVDVNDSAGNVVDQVNQTNRQASGVNAEPMGLLHLAGTFDVRIFTGPNCDWHVTARSAPATS